MSELSAAQLDGRLADLLAELRALLPQADALSRARWNRSLPFPEYIGDRWERARRLGFGDGTSIYDSSVVIGDVRVGKNVWIGPFTILDGSGGLEIGDNCSVSAGVQIYSHDTVDWALSGGSLPVRRGAVRIGSCCYIGPNSIISRGVTIGSRVVVGANSLVNRDIPDDRRAWGTPATIRPDPVPEASPEDA